MPTNDRIRKITILQLPSERIQSRIINGYTHSAKLSPHRVRANCKAKNTDSVVVTQENIFIPKRFMLTF